MLEEMGKGEVLCINVPCGAQTLRSLHCHVFFVTAWAAGCVLLNQQHRVHLPCLALLNPEKKQRFPVCSSAVT